MHGQPRLRFDQRILLWTLAAGLPATVTALLLVWRGDYAARLQWTVTVLLVGVWAVCSFAVRQRVVLPLQTLSNLLAALRERDFSIRARGASHRQDDPLAAVMLEVNELASTLHDQRLGAIEAGALLRTAVAEIDVAVFTFDSSGILRLVNRAGERLLGQPAADLLGRHAEDLELRPCLSGPVPRVEDVAFPGGSGRWEIRRTSFREDGRPHQLLVLADVSRPLRDEERQAWQRLIRVLGHEINNSLAPIKSIAGSLASMIGTNGSSTQWTDDMRDDMTRGLAVIGSRADSLSRFTTGYARLARLPAPHFARVRASDLVERAVEVETRLMIDVHPGPDLTLNVDRDQIEQLLINILRNGVEAALETGGGVSLGWDQQGRTLSLWIDDEGAGLSNASNLFVPFFTTKPGGSGIGLVLSRHIAEAHGGTLNLENRSDRAGCRALLRLPLD